ncbi:phospholipase D-like domain-containing protein [Alkalibacillus filiformis]|uniref:phospholipase D-like domain-containing protein n=1 Tax=Alkalibacillus filiformis TaxID=200990 RepID=UPI0027D80D51|nr:phospholipase D-like domain-containing protein [Alkalibacillus filiformis]
MQKKSILMSMLLVLAVTLSFLTHFDGGNNAKADANSVIISEVYYDTQVSYEPDEYVAIHNPLSEAVDLSGWQIGEIGTKAVFPDGTLIESGETLYIVREANVALEQNILNGIAPDFEYSDNTVDEVPNMEGDAPRFANNGDEVLLRDPDHNLVDIVIYGESDYDGDGWTGDSIPTGSSGDVLVRNTNEKTGVLVDTDTYNDWVSLKGNPLAESDELRTYKQAQSRFDLERFEFTGSVTAYTSPDSSYEVLSTLIDSAMVSIDLSVYQMHSPYLTEHLVDALERGVEVRAHFDGGPVGGLTDETRWVSQQLYEAGGQVRYITLDRDEDRHKRYRWDHSKYAIIDEEKLLVQSENWKRTGVPVDNSAGNRGYGVVIENEDVAQYYLDVFETDWDDRFPDVVAHSPNHDVYGNPPEDFDPDYSIPTGNYEAQFESKTIDGDFVVTPVIAPDTSFLIEDSILGMINSASDYVYVDQMYSHAHWGAQDDGPETHPNIYMEEVIDAGRNGATVRFLLGDSWLDPDNSRDNTNTISYLNDISDDENLDLEAKLVDSSSIGIDKTHNKAVVADDQVLISSINWSKNSGKNNREAAVIIENEEVANFYKEVFEHDWVGGNPSFVYEDFEDGWKSSYSAGDVELQSGSWHFDNALTGSHSSDKKIGDRSARIRSNGSISMNYDAPEAQYISFYHANFGSDTEGEITVYKSTDEGNSWIELSETFKSQYDLERVILTVDEPNDVRFKIEVTGPSGERINIDDFEIMGY